ncbi:MAG: hypothetical protein A2161_21090 [Candidatus Schekmanbacteria bacterium RBG_13_48_7]|uniref:Rrf2 family transcriptional regulator n=1 Tax=Candidatus Schekmanbacteria bacterium RBG_13_48_7 TaxID=1817878 RepID=A0A1F7RLM4_9BACT|nr:MAG: hypothetical protein A2161_21090 [Candidatus Schekmanbacteria bacterium RBG_13_48_7]
MNQVLKISEAASLALHTMMLLAENSDKLVSTKDIASTLKVSEAHLSKVLQRLTKVGMVSAIRGPKGGFRLGRSTGEITLLDIYESIEGPMGEHDCLFTTPVCTGENCILGDLLSSVNTKVRKYFNETHLSDLNGVKKFEYVRAGK